MSEYGKSEYSAASAKLHEQIGSHLEEFETIITAVNVDVHAANAATVTQLEVIERFLHGALVALSDRLEAI